MIAISRIISQEPFNQNAAASLCNTCTLPSDIRHVFTVPLNVLSFSHDLSVDQVLDKYYDKQNAFDILIQNGADPSLEDNDGSSLIHSAAEGRSTSIINKLLSLGLDIKLKDVYGVTPLTRAIEKTNFDAVKFLISKGAL